MDCCDVYADQFDRESAIRQAQRYRERGLDRTARHMLEALVARGGGEGRVLDIGGGVGALSLELIKAGAGSAINVELSTQYQQAARALALEAGLEDRAEIRVGDAVAAIAEIGSADIVVMNRVVCCYADGDALMDAAAGASTRLLAVSYPSLHFGSRALVAIENRLRARRGSEFRAFVHPRSTIGRPVALGFEEVGRRSGPIWSIVVWERN